ncbi:MAG: hypothetical protein JW715_14095 [Sedimentisphaerales bacterium]|nr:hypothetical protein [Sedimentisphaerales bacterium]
MNKGVKITLIILLATTGFLFSLGLVVCSSYIAKKVRIWQLTKDMTGGTSLAYEIDASDFTEEQKKNLSKKMIFALKKRIDPDGKLPIIWKPLDDTHLEIQLSPVSEFPDAKDIQHMLRNLGILEFRILPTLDHPEVDSTAMNNYIERLQVQGPEYASDDQNIWIEIEDANEWKCTDSEGRPAIVGEFGGKTYVLASNKPGKVILFEPGEKTWRLEKAYMTTDEMGRRAIGFSMNLRGRMLMGEVTGNNIGRPLCIILDEIAISAPNIQERIPGEGRINGRFSQTEVEDMVNKLNAGSLPARLIEESVEIRTITQKNGS